MTILVKKGRYERSNHLSNKFLAIFSKNQSKEHIEILRQQQEKTEILNELHKTKLALEHAYSNFENVIEPDLIDSSIYELNAINKQYKFLLERVRQLNAYQ